ncbi:MAG: hypothetical protein EPO32_12535 [Anaerolineae bacterium]|nr:MAG: hypothetical protein EPO32_12535 [Anaerolineae bacterium]
MASRQLHTLLVSALALTALLAACTATATPETPPGIIDNAPVVSTLDGLVDLPVPKGLAGNVTLGVALGASFQIADIDMTSGAVTVRHITSGDAWFNGLATAPDGRTMVAFAPPPESGLQLGLSGLYTLNADGALQPWLARDTATFESFLHPNWTPDGALVYARYRTLDDGSQPYMFSVERRTSPEEEAVTLVENAAVPAVSPDGEWLAALRFEPNAGNNALLLARADGSDLHELLPEAEYPIVDAPAFSADGQWVYFTLPESGVVRSEHNWWDDLFGVRTAYAHNLPANWWRVAVAGGAPQQVTFDVFTQLNGALSPDGEWLLSASDQGLFLVDLASGQVTFILKGSVQFYAAVDWRP